VLDDGSRLGWLIAGQELLRSGGFQSVKLAALCELTGRTTGSFYHHFDGMAAYLGELASFFGVEQPKTVLAELSRLEPERRLARLEHISAELHAGALHRAMRDWATVNEPAAEAVRAADTMLLEFIRDSFIAQGVPRPVSELQAEVVYALAIVRMDTPWRRRSTSIARVLKGLGGGPSGVSTTSSGGGGSHSGVDARSAGDSAN